MWKVPCTEHWKVGGKNFWWPSDTTFNTGQIFSTHHNTSWKNAWRSFTAVVENFLRNFKALKYDNLLKQLLNSYEKVGCNMSVKIHFLHSHVNNFSENLEAWWKSKEESFHQDMKTMGKRYQGRWNTNMMAGYCWYWKREVAGSSYSLKTQKRHFQD